MALYIPGDTNCKKIQPVRIWKPVASFKWSVSGSVECLQHIVACNYTFKPRLISHHNPQMCRHT